MIFSGKASCVKRYDEIMKQPGVCTKVKGDIVEVTNEKVLNALKLMADIPRLVDLIYKHFPAAYNSASPGFGRIKGIKVFDPSKYKDNPKKYLKKRPVSFFYQEECDYKYGDGYIYPLVFALRTLMEWKPDGSLGWKVNSPDHFLEKNLPEILKTYHSMISGQNYDPAKVGKEPGCYNIAVSMFEFALMKAS